MKVYQCQCGYEVAVKNRFRSDEEWTNQPFIDINKVLGVKEYVPIALMACPVCKIVQYEYR